MLSSPTPDDPPFDPESPGGLEPPVGSPEMSGARLPETSPLRLLSERIFCALQDNRILAPGHRQAAYARFLARRAEPFLTDDPLCSAYVSLLSHPTMRHFQDIKELGAAFRSAAARSPSEGEIAGALHLVAPLLSPSPPSREGAKLRELLADGRCGLGAAFLTALTLERFGPLLTESERLDALERFSERSDDHHHSRSAIDASDLLAVRLRALDVPRPAVFAYQAALTPALGRDTSLVRMRQVLAALDRMLERIAPFHETYQANGWDISALVESVCEFCGPSSFTNVQQRDAYSAVLSSFAGSGFRVDPLLRMTEQIAGQRYGEPELRRCCERLSRLFVSREDYESPLPAHAFSLLVRELPERLADDALRIARYLPEESFQRLSTMVGQLQALRALDTSLRSTREQVAAGALDTTNSAIVWRHLKGVVSDAAFVKVVQHDKSPGVLDTARAVLKEYYRNDSPPYRLFEPMTEKLTPESRRCISECYEVAYRAFDMKYGFSALTFDAARPSGSERSLLDAFVRDVACSGHRLNVSRGDRYPGAGYVINGIDLERVLLPNPQTPNDPYSGYKAAWSWACNEVEEMASTRFILSRGAVIVWGPGNPRFLLHGVHYSYLVLNDHFPAKHAHGAYLVPTDALKEAFSGTTVPASVYRGFDPERRDAITAPLDLESLALIAWNHSGGGLPRPIVTLASPTILGGLCNGYPAQKGPHHLWEQDVKTRFKDLAGHVHKTFIMDGDYRRTIDPEVEARLASLRQAHTDVYQVATRYQNLFDLLRLQLSAYHKGETASDDPPCGAADLFDSPHANRMLRWSYSWHRARAHGIDDPNRFPVLVAAEPLDYWNRPRSPFRLDTFSMQLTVGGEVVQLPRESDGDGRLELRAWKKHVLPHMVNRNDLRFYDRRDL